MNKGNCLFITGDLDRAKEVYLEAIGVSADCLEAIYNLGLVNSHMGKMQESMLAFDKLHSITHNNIEVKRFCVRSAGEHVRSAGEHVRSAGDRVRRESSSRQFVTGGDKLGMY